MKTNEVIKMNYDFQRSAKHCRRVPRIARFPVIPSVIQSFHLLFTGLHSVTLDAIVQDRSQLNNR